MSLVFVKSVCYASIFKEELLNFWNSESKDLEGSGLFVGRFLWMLSLAGLNCLPISFI